MDATELLRVARQGHQSPETESQRITTLGNVENYSLSRDYVPVKGGELELEVESVELVGKRTGKKEYFVYVKIGDSANVTALPATNAQECSRIMNRLEEGDYSIRIENGVLGVELQPTQ